MSSITERRTLRSFFGRPGIWAFTTYFAEGFPFSMIRTVSSLFFRDMKVSLEMIGLTSLFGIPWTFKFLWSPAVDRYGTKRTWLLAMEAFLVILFFTLPFLVEINGFLGFIGLLLFAGSFLAATHDIAVDGFYMEALDKNLQSAYVGFRVMAYRIAMMVGTGIIATVGTTASWFYAYLLAGVIFCGLFVFHLFFLPQPQKAGGIEDPGESGWVFFRDAFTAFFNRQGIVVIILFIVLLRAGEFMLTSMLSPFFVDIGVKMHYGWISSLVGLPASIAGAILGGRMIAKWGMGKTIFPLTLAQNVPNLFYAGLAWALSGFSLAPSSLGQATTDLSVAGVAIVHGLEQFGAGMGNAVLMVFLMRLCMKEFKAAHYAIGSGLMSLSGIVTGVFSGFFAANLGFTVLFAASFIVSVPAMILIFFLPAAPEKE